MNTTASISHNASSERPLQNYEQQEAKHAYEKGSKVAIRTVLIVLAILAGILLVLFIVSRAALYDSIPLMLSDMWAAFVELVSRIFS